MDQSNPSMRLDKWLWAARFFKHRKQATEAIQGGKVHLNGQRVKPARGVQVGDRLEITRGVEEMTVIVEGLADKRGPASVAQTLYQETEQSQVTRTEAREMRRLLAQNPADKHRPDKRDRRKLRALSGKA
jgi:ribosome-associated heat shock protein Hsp15